MNAWKPSSRPVPRVPARFRLPLNLPRNLPRRNPPSLPPAVQAPAEITGRIRRVAEGPVDSVPAPSSAERSSQVRARDRATLRTIKELAEKEGHLAPGGAPTRRQLRLLQLAAETAPATRRI